MKRDTDKRHIGSLIRIMRKAAGLSQMKLAERVGISYQQIQKYEKGVSEISVSRLSQIAHALNIPLSRFVLDEEKMMVSESVSPYGTLSDNEIELLKLFRRIKDKKLKDGFLIAIKSIAELSENKDAKKKPKALAS
ncbi:MAG: helix-turn-helix transcriptional regulator [Thermodesulfovibrionales bacterium]|nr:helix-turn-helix transcriptional regulator [Thermodesulfovibrionales bacterium]